MSKHEVKGGRCGYVPTSVRNLAQQLRSVGRERTDARDWEYTIDAENVKQ